MITALSGEQNVAVAIDRTWLVSAPCLVTVASDTIGMNANARIAAVFGHPIRTNSNVIHGLSGSGCSIGHSLARQCDSFVKSSDEI